MISLLLTLILGFASDLCNNKDVIHTKVSNIITKPQLSNTKTKPRASQTSASWALLPLWTGRSLLSPVSFKLPLASVEGGQSLASKPITHYPVLSAQGKYCNGNSVLKVDGSLGNLPVQFPGATVLVIQYEILDCYYQQKITVSSTPAAVTANGSALEIVGQIIMPISIAQFHSSQLFTVVCNLTVDCILGVDYFMQHGTVIDCKHCCATMGRLEFSFYAQPVQSNSRDRLHKQL